MKITEHNGFICIEDVTDFAAASSECVNYYNRGFCAVVFIMNSNAALTAEQKTLLMELPLITAVYSDSISEISADTLMSFDLRFSAAVFQADAETLQAADCNRFAVLFGQKNALELADSVKNGFDGVKEIEYFSVYNESFEEYFERMFKEKNTVQNQALTECLVSLRNGCTEKGFEKEAVNFYRLIKETTKD